MSRINVIAAPSFYIGRLIEREISKEFLLTPKPSILVPIDSGRALARVAGIESINLFVACSNRKFNEPKRDYTYTDFVADLRNWYKTRAQRTIGGASAYNKWIEVFLP